MSAEPRTTPPRPARLLLAALTLLPLLVTLGGCGYGSRAAGDDTGKAAAEGRRTGGLDEVRIGYFANVTHATALVGDGGGFLQRELGGTKVSPQVFNAGPSAIEALNAGSLDIAWLGPSPAINGYAKSDGKSLRIISGAASGGVSLVVDPDTVKGLDDLAGKRIATPQIGNTQDVALLDYLAGRKLEVDPATGKGDVTVVRQDNKEIPTSFERGDLDGAWVPEPTASKLVSAGGRVLLDEEKLWKDGRFVITNVVVSQDFLREHPDAVEAVLRGSVKANAWIEDHPGEAKRVVNERLEELSGKALPREVLDPAFAHVDVLDDPLASTLREQAEHAVTAGLLDEADLEGIYDLRLLNKVLAAEGRPAVDDAGLGAR